MQSNAFEANWRWKSLSNTKNAYRSEWDGRMGFIWGVAMRRGTVVLRCCGAVASLDHLRHNGGDDESISKHDKQQSFYFHALKGWEW